MMLKSQRWIEEGKNESAISGSLWDKENKKKAVTIGIASGKGGVGKTTLAVGLSLKLAKDGYKVLLIDLDYNLSNTVIKLGLPINNNFYDFLKEKKSFFEVVYNLGNLHILGGCSGNLELFERKLAIDKLITEVISEYENYYDYILLDSPSGASKEIVMLNSLCDHRLIIVDPDRSSITDAYSFIKLLKVSFGVGDNFIIINKVLRENQFQKIGKVFQDMTANFLKTHVDILGSIGDLGDISNIYDDDKIDFKDHEFFIVLNKLWENFKKLTKNMAEFENRNIDSSKERYFY